MTLPASELQSTPLLPNTLLIGLIVAVPETVFLYTMAAVVILHAVAVVLCAAVAAAPPYVVAVVVPPSPKLAAVTPLEDLVTTVDQLPSLMLRIPLTVCPLVCFGTCFVPVSFTNHLSRTTHLCLEQFNTIPGTRRTQFNGILIV